MTITRNFKLCLNAGTQNAPYINVNQYDEGEEWVFDLYTEGGQKFVPSTGAIIGIKSDGNAILNSGTVNASGQVVITETQQMTAASGLAVFELLIEGETHGTANFIVNVERRPSDDAEFSDSDLSMLQEAIDAAEVINEILDAGGDPSEIIAENVDAWLDNHPEATTTVEDGAITAPKINNSLWDKILVNEEASGNPASFDDGADDVPVSSLKVALEPVQLGSGDPSPSNIRPIIAANGINVWDEVWELGGISNQNGTNYGASDRIRSKNYIPCLPSTTYYFKTPAIMGTVAFYNSSQTFISALSNFAGGTFTTPANTKYIRFCGTNAYGATYNNDISINYPSSYSAYQPYQGIMVDVKGRNLYPIAIGADTFSDNVGSSHSNDNGTLVVTTGTGTSSGVYSSVASKTRSISATYIGAITYSFKVKTSSNVTVQIGFQGGGAKNVNATTDWQTVTISTTSTGVMAFIVYTNGTSATIYVKDFMFEMGSEAHEYVPYNGVSYPISLGRDVYGGTLDVSTGVLTVTKKFVTSSNFVKETSYDVGNSSLFSVTEINDANINPALNRGSISDKLKYDTAILNVERAGFYVGYGHIYARIAGISTLSDFNTAIGGSLSVAYTLATPQTIQLTPTEVKTLLGYNNISSTGTVDVIYHADTKLYIDKKIGELS